MTSSLSAAKQLAFVGGLALVIGAAMALAGATVHHAVKPNLQLPFGLDAYVSPATADMLVRWKYQFLIDKHVEVRPQLEFHDLMN